MAKERVEKRSQKRSEQSSKDRIMYSKIPSYLLSGRQPLARERRMSEISSLSESSDSEGVASTSIRRRLVNEHFTVIYRKRYEQLNGPNSHQLLLFLSYQD